LEFLPIYDELWAISDIHMGGEKSKAKDFQIFCRGERLGNFIRYLIRQNPQDDVALVLDGDVIDSLAEDVVPGYTAVDLPTITAMMKHLYEDPGFEPVWSALHDFVHTEKRHLVIVIGNHDIELALTPVEASIRERLAAGDAKANGRITFSTHGGGFGCRVGGKRVFCTHGNEVDDWNIVDYNELGNLDNAIRAGRRIDESRWRPNAGTRMVIDLMNDVKARFPFVDLLKPEINPVLSIVLTLDSSLVKKVSLSSSFKIIRDRVSGVLKTRNLLSAGEDVESVETEDLTNAAMPELLGNSVMAQIRGMSVGDSEDELLVTAEVNMVTRKPAIGTTSEGATLGWSDIVAGKLGLVDRVEALRRALKDWLSRDTTFDLSDRDPTFTAIVPRVGSDVDFIITGHTHLARAIEFEPGRHYFNCGTWIRLLRLTEKMLEENVFANLIYPALKAGTMEELDKPIAIDETTAPLVLDRTNAVRISKVDGVVKGSLCRIRGGENDAPIEVAEEKGIDQ